MDNYNIDEIRISVFDEVEKIIKALYGVSNIEWVNLVIYGNKLIIIESETLLIDIPLKTEPYLPQPIGITFNINRGERLPANCTINNKPCNINHNVIPQVLQIYNQYSMYANSSIPIASEQNLINNQEFMQAANSKQFRLFKMRRNDQIGVDCLVPLIPGIFKLNKGDNIGINVYEDNEFIIIDLNVSKSKLGRSYHTYYKSLKL